MKKKPKASVAATEKKPDRPIYDPPPKPPAARRSAADRNRKRRDARAAKKAVEQARIDSVVEKLTARDEVAVEAPAVAVQSLTERLTGFGLSETTAKAIRTVAKALDRPEEAIIAGMVSAEFYVAEQVLDLVLRADVVRKRRDAEARAHDKGVEARVRMISEEAQETAAAIVANADRQIGRLRKAQS